MWVPICATSPVVLVLETGSPANSAGHEDYDLVSVFLSSKSQRRFGFPNQISRCTPQWDKVEFTRLARSLSPFLQDPTCLGPSMKVSYKQICILFHLLYSESDSVFRLTPVCLAVSLVVYSLFSCSHCILIQDKTRNVNASTRALRWSTTLDGRRPIKN